MLCAQTTALAPLLGTDSIIGFDATYDGRIILLTISADTAGRYPLERDPRGERWYFANGRPTAPFEASAIIVNDAGTRRIRLPVLTACFPHCQLLPDDEILVADSRCDVLNGRDNAFVYGPDGRLRRSFPLGDGIEHLQTLPDGQIWVGYFDEGIFGNIGWESKPWVRKAARSGLACFEHLEGRLRWRYHCPPDGEHIGDCDALNATPEGTWACTYANYPLTFIRPDGGLRYWSNSVPGTQSLVVAGPDLLFWDGGALPEDEVRAVIQRVVGDELVMRNEVKLTLPDGSPLDGRTATVQGRGRYLHVLHGTEWHRYDLASPLPG
jgi:hypothetical protein